jgi:septal ring factor EnvC (AmiA/AmiB activator)
VSGREHEPVTAFFPSIDRNLILDLDRHLRGGKPLPDASGRADPAQPATLPAVSVGQLPPASAGLRPNIASVVQAVEHAAHSIAAMTARIEELESHIDQLEANNRHFEAQLGEAEQALQLADAKLRTEGERAMRAESAAAHQTARAMDLERELTAVHGDLARVTEAITAALGLPPEEAV